MKHMRTTTRTSHVMLLTRYVASAPQIDAYRLNKGGKWVATVIDKFVALRHIKIVKQMRDMCPWWSKANAYIERHIHQFYGNNWWWEKHTMSLWCAMPRTDLWCGMIPRSIRIGPNEFKYIIVLWETWTL